MIKYDVLIAGGGFAGIYCARVLRRRLGRKSRIRIGLISEENYMVYQPMLAEVVGASVSPRHVINPIRHLCRGIDVLKGEIRHFDLASRRASLDAGSFTPNLEIDFDHLVLTLGAIVDLSMVPGMTEHAYLMRNVGDAMHLRSTVISRLEEANLQEDEETKKRLLTIVVVGGGYSGVETAGQILDLCRSVHPYYHNIRMEDFRVILIHSGEGLLPGLTVELGSYAERKLQERGLEIILGQRVRAVTATNVVLADGRRIGANTVVSTIGNAPHPLLIDLAQTENLPTERGRVITDSFLRVDPARSIWSAGDCAAVPLKDGGRCPPTAQFAMRQGKLLGRNLAAALTGRDDLEPFTFTGLGELASIGHRTAVANVMGLQFSGFIAWWMWRTIYLAKLPRLDRKIRVVIDWTLYLFLPRDINQLSPRYSKTYKDIHLTEGDFLFHKGEPAFSFYIVKEGCIHLMDDGRTEVSVGPGDHFGERALLTDKVWNFDAVAAKPTTLVSISADLFRQLAEGSGAFETILRHTSLQYQSARQLEEVGRRFMTRPPEATAREVMQKEVVTVRTSDSLAEVLRTLRRHAFGSFPVLDDSGCIEGTLTRQSLYDFLQHETTRHESSIAGITFGSTPSIAPEMKAPEILSCMIRNGTHQVHVVDADGRLLGLVAFIDLIAAPEPATQPKPRP